MMNEEIQKEPIQNEPIQENNQGNSLERNKEWGQGWMYAPKPQNTLYHTKVKENFHIYGVATFLFACLYAFCMYRNPSGITYVLFVAAGIFYINFCLKKLEIESKKGKNFYTVSMILLAVSTFCTDDGRIIFFNKLGVFLLTISMLLWMFYNTEKWNLAKFLQSIFDTCIGVFGEIGTPFADAMWYVKNKLDKKNCKYLYALIGLVVSIPLFIIVLLLLTSADIVFKNMADNILSGFKFNNIILTVWLIFFMFVACYGILVLLCRHYIKEEVKDKRTGEPLIAIPVATILSLLYIVFSGVQFIYLFMGNMELPAGYTYAEYAREGFFQLLAVGILNLILVLVGLCYFRPNKVLKLILTVMSACTFVMLISSAMRMIIYIQYYYLTFLRILVLWSLLVLFIIFAGVIVYIYKEDFPLFRYSMVAVTVLYLVLSFGHPDYWIAKVNLAGSEESRSEFFLGSAYSDDYFLSNLSADAAPALAEWGHPHYRARYAEHLEERIGDIGIRNFNVSRVVAEKMMY